MPVLSSFMGYRPKRKAKPAKPQPTRRFETTSLSHPYASPQVLDIIDSDRPITPTFKPIVQPPVPPAQSTHPALLAPAPVPPPPKAPEEVIPRSSVSGTPSESPKVQLDLDAEPLDWFGGHSFLKPTSFVYGSAAPLTASNTAGIDKGANLSAEDPQGMSKRADMEDGISISSDDILEHKNPSGVSVSFQIGVKINHNCTSITAFTLCHEHDIGGGVTQSCESLCHLSLVDFSLANLV